MEVHIAWSPEIEIGPVFHPRLPTRIHAHASLCFLAPILHG